MEQDLYRAELADVCQHIFGNLAGPGTMQEESCFEVLHLDGIKMMRHSVAAKLEV